MGIIVNKENDKNSELARRIDADLRVKVAGKNHKKDPDLAEDAEYMKDLSGTSRFAWVWVVLGILAVGILIAIGIR